MWKTKLTKNVIKNVYHVSMTAARFTAGVGNITSCIMYEYYCLCFLYYNFTMLHC